MDDGVGKKAVHVKWAGKTIALGTFPSSEADEKCARAKALTRAWRSTMRPKPTREWVMTELERLGVRIVSGKLGRKPDQEQDEDGGGSGNGNGVSSSKAQAAAAPTPMGASSSVMAAQDRLTQQRRDSGMGVSNGSLGGMPSGSSGQVNQHYEMLKLHHMNLLQELHETTMMMNMYQQQQLQASQTDTMIRRGSLGMGIYSGGQRGSLGLGTMGSRGSLGLGSSFGGGLSHRGSLGLGGTGASSLGGLANHAQFSNIGGEAMIGQKRESLDQESSSAKRFKGDGGD